jgi:AraC-like DNA-binding protein
MKEIKTIKSITEVHQLLGLEKPQHPLVSVVNNENVCFTADLRNSRYVFDLYLISLKSGVSGSLGYGRNSYDFEEGTMIFTSPGQVITVGELQKEENKLDGWTLLFHPDLIRKSGLGKTIEHYSFFSYDANEALHLSDKEKNSITDLVIKIKEECNQNIDRHTQKLIISNIELLLDYCTRYFDRQFATRTNFNKDIVTKFENFVKDYFNSDKLAELGIPTVQYIGKQLSMSPNYLSDLLKKETGRNAQEYIHMYLIEKAKNTLLNSSQSVSEIAYELGFAYPQHFAKLFKNRTGLSPTEFRNLN